MISIICFSIILIIVIETHFNKSDFFTPFKIYLFFQSLTFGIASLKYSPAMTSFATKTNIVYFGSGFSFLVGCVTVRLLSTETKIKPTTFEEKNYNWNLHIIISISVFLLFLLGYLMCIKSYGTLPAFTKTRAGSVIAFYESNPVGSILANFSAIVMILFFIAGYNIANKTKKYLCYFVMCLTFGLYLMILSRYLLMFFIFFLLVFYSINSKKLYISKLVMFSLVIMLFLISTFFLKFSHVMSGDALKTVLKNEKVIEVGLKLPYQYIANNYWNLDFALNPPNYEHRHSTTYGYSMVSGFFDFFPGIANEIRRSYNLDTPKNESVQKIKGLNTIGYQWSIYKSFGLIGTLIIPFILGYFISLIYLRAYYNPNIYNHTLYAYLSFSVATCFSQPQWEMFIYLYGLMFILFTIFLCRNPLKRITPLTS